MKERVGGRQRSVSFLLFFSLRERPLLVGNVSTYYAVLTSFLQTDSLSIDVFGLFFHLFLSFVVFLCQAEVEFDFNMDGGKQELSSKLSRLQMQAAQFPDVKSTSYKVTESSFFILQ